MHEPLPNLAEHLTAAELAAWAAGYLAGWDRGAAFAREDEADRWHWQRMDDAHREHVRRLARHAARVDRRRAADRGELA